MSENSKWRNIILAAGIGLTAGCGADSKPKEEIFTQDEYSEANEGQSIMPEEKDLGIYFASAGETLRQEFLQAIKNLPATEKEKLQQEWERIAKLEEAKMYERRFGNSDKWLRRFLKHIIEDKEFQKQLKELVEKYCLKYGVPADIIWGVVGVESGGNPYARSASKPSARGILQLMPATARAMGLRVELNDSDEVVGKDERYDVEKNIEAGVKFLALLKGRFGSWGLALVAFCEGPTQLSAQLKHLKVPEKKKDLVHLYAGDFYGLGKVHPFQYPFYAYAMGKQMLSAVNEGKTIPVAEVLKK